MGGVVFVCFWCYIFSQRLSLIDFSTLWKSLTLGRESFSLTICLMAYVVLLTLLSCQTFAYQVCRLSLVFQMKVRSQSFLLSLCSALVQVDNTGKREICIWFIFDLHLSHRLAVPLEMKSSYDKRLDVDYPIYDSNVLWSFSSAICFAIKQNPCCIIHVVVL